MMRCFAIQIFQERIYMRSVVRLFGGSQPLASIHFRRFATNFAKCSALAGVPKIVKTLASNS